MLTLRYYLFLYLPDPVLNGLLMLAGYLRAGYRLLASRRLAVTLYTGPRAGHDLRLLWIGPPDLQADLLSAMYPEGYAHTVLPPSSPWRVRRTLAVHADRHDVAYVAQNALLPPLPAAYRVKPFVRMIVPVTASNRHNYSKSRRLTRKYQITFQDFVLSAHPARLRQFYDELYAPHIALRWGADRVESFAELRAHYAKGILRLAYIDGQAVAGTIMLVQGPTLVACKYGVRDAQNKAHRAAESFFGCLTYAEEHQLTHLDGFHCRPWLKDLGFQYKRGWGAHVRFDPRLYYSDHDFFLRVQRSHPGVRDFLCQQPFLSATGRQLDAHIWCRAAGDGLVDAMAEQHRQCQTPGIARYVFHLPRPLTVTEVAAWQQIAHQIPAPCELRVDHTAFEARPPDVVCE